MASTTHYIICSLPAQIVEHDLMFAVGVADRQTESIALQCWTCFKSCFATNRWIINWYFSARLLNFIARVHCSNLKQWMRSVVFEFLFCIGSIFVHCGVNYYIMHKNAVKALCQRQLEENTQIWFQRRSNIYQHVRFRSEHASIKCVYEFIEKNKWM